MDTGNRKLIRPSFNEFKEKGEQPRKAGAAQKRPVPPDQTNAENFYYVKQMQSKTPMVITAAGVTAKCCAASSEWYDRGCLKLNREGGPQRVALPKSNIKYMHKDESAGWLTARAFTITPCAVKTRLSSITATTGAVIGGIAGFRNRGGKLPSNSATLDGSSRPPVGRCSRRCSRRPR